MGAECKVGRTVFRVALRTACIHRTTLALERRPCCHTILPNTIAIALAQPRGSPMPRPRTKAQQTQQPAASSNGETTSGYFRRLFRADPKLLKKDTNAQLFERWLQD